MVSGIAWETSAISTLTDGFGSAVAKLTSCLPKTVRCTPCGVRRSSINTVRFTAARWLALGKGDNRTPAIVVEPEEGHFPEDANAEQKLKAELLQLAAGSELTSRITRVLFHRSLPVDTRHNVKINREALGQWAAEQKVDY